MYVHHESRWHSAAILLAFLFSWAYVTTIFLSAWIMFHVVCNLQIIHLEDYRKLLERESDVLVLLQEHARLRHYLSKISHRFRICLLLQFLIVTISQFLTLFQTTGYNGIITCINGGITCINGGNFAASSLVQVVGIILCLNAAAKISHIAQGVGALASRWHALVTCSANEASLMRSSNSMGSLETTSQVLSILTTGERLGVPRFPCSTNEYTTCVLHVFVPQMTCSSNPGGITILGWAILYLLS